MLASDAPSEDSTFCTPQAFYVLWADLQKTLNNMLDMSASAEETKEKHTEIEIEEWHTDALMTAMRLLDPEMELVVEAYRQVLCATMADALLFMEAVSDLSSPTKCVNPQVCHQKKVRPNPLIGSFVI